MDDGLHGFEVRDGLIPRPPIQVSDEIRDRWRHILMAMVDGDQATPEDIAAFLADGFPPAVTEALERPHERDEMDAMIDLLLFAQQSPALTG